MKGLSFKSWQLSSLRLHALPVLVWLAAVGGVVTLFFHRTQRFEVIGIAQGQVHQIAANCEGRLISMPVQLFQEVGAGETVAIVDTVLDNEHLQAQLAVVKAEIQHLKAQLAPIEEQMAADAANSQINKLTTLRRFSVDVENARIRLLELKTMLEANRIMLEDLAVEVKIVQRLVDQDALGPYELQKVQVQYNALAKQIEADERVLAQAGGDLERAQQRRDEFAEMQPQFASVDSTLNVIRKEMEVHAQRIEEILARRTPLVLKAPFDGVVIQIWVNANQAGLLRPGEDVLRRPGEVVLAGEPILAIAETKPREIIAYASQEQANRVEEGMAVKIIKRSQPAQIVNSQVAYLGPAIELMPQQLWRNPNIPEWGRPLLIAVHPDMKLIPGELVGIKGL